MTLAERLIQKGALEVAREIACRLWNMGWPPVRIFMKGDHSITSIEIG